MATYTHTDAEVHREKGEIQTGICFKNYFLYDVNVGILMNIFLKITKQ